VKFIGRVFLRSLDKTLTELDNQFNSIKYPTISIRNKPNHNPNFDKNMSESEPMAYINEYKDGILKELSQQAAQFDPDPIFNFFYKICYLTLL
jgi:hypothetical protein